MLIKIKSLLYLAEKKILVGQVQIWTIKKKKKNPLLRSVNIIEINTWK